MEKSRVNPIIFVLSLTFYAQDLQYIEYFLTPSAMKVLSARGLNNFGSINRTDCAANRIR